MSIYSKKFKDYFINFLTTIIAVIICLLIINIIFIKISNQKYFPRALANSLSNVLLTFYPVTYDNKNLNEYVALLGDSYSQGAGDAYLAGINDYSIAHHLHKHNNKNYLNFGRGGYGSISATSNLIMVQKMSKLPNLIKDLKPPKSIIFIFYEGNDLEENVYEFNFLSKPNEEISNFVKRRIEENVKLKKIDKLNNIFPLLIFIKKIYIHFSWHLSLMLNQMKNAGSFEEFSSLFTDRIKKLFGKTVVLNVEKTRASTDVNFIKENDKVKNIQPLQSSAVILEKNEILIGLEIFFESIKYIKKRNQVENIHILYIPSPINSYTWTEPIAFEFKDPINGDTNSEFNKTNNEENLLNSILIRNKIDYFSQMHNIKFIDATDFINEKGNEIILHGPLDWRHFNYNGYKHISNFLIENLSKN